MEGSLFEIIEGCNYTDLFYHDFSDFNGNAEQLDTLLRERAHSLNIPDEVETTATVQIWDLVSVNSIDQIGIESAKSESNEESYAKPSTKHTERSHGTVPSLDELHVTVVENTDQNGDTMKSELNSSSADEAALRFDEGYKVEEKTDPVRSLGELHVAVVENTDQNGNVTVKSELNSSLPDGTVPSLNQLHVAVVENTDQNGDFTMKSELNSSLPDEEVLRFDEGYTVEEDNDVVLRFNEGYTVEEDNDAVPSLDELHVAVVENTDQNGDVIVKSEFIPCLHNEEVLRFDEGYKVEEDTDELLHLLPDETSIIKDEETDCNDPLDVTPPVIPKEEQIIELVNYGGDQSEEYPTPFVEFTPCDSLKSVFSQLLHQSMSFFTSISNDEVSDCDGPVEKTLEEQPTFFEEPLASSEETPELLDYLKRSFETNAFSIQDQFESTVHSDFIPVSSDGSQTQLTRDLPQINELLENNIPLACLESPKLFLSSSSPAHPVSFHATWAPLDVEVIGVEDDECLPKSELPFDEEQQYEPMIISHPKSTKTAGPLKPVIVFDDEKNLKELKFVHNNSVLKNKNRNLPQTRTTRLARNKKNVSKKKDDAALRLWHRREVVEAKNLRPRKEVVESKNLRPRKDVVESKNLRPRKEVVESKNLRPRKEVVESKNLRPRKMNDTYYNNRSIIKSVILNTQNPILTGPKKRGRPRKNLVTFTPFQVKQEFGNFPEGFTEIATKTRDPAKILPTSSPLHMKLEEVNDPLTPWSPIKSMRRLPTLNRRKVKSESSTLSANSDTFNASISSGEGTSYNETPAQSAVVLPTLKTEPSTFWFNPEQTCSPNEASILVCDVNANLSKEIFGMRGTKFEPATVVFPRKDLEGHSSHDFRFENSFVDYQDCVFPPSFRNPIQEVNNNAGVLEHSIKTEEEIQSNSLSDRVAAADLTNVYFNTGNGSFIGQTIAGPSTFGLEKLVVNPKAKARKRYIKTEADKLFPNPKAPCHLKSETRAEEYYSESEFTNTRKRMRYAKEEYLCGICKYRCSVESSFLKHVTNHINNPYDKPFIYSCDICGFDFKTESDTNRHMIEAHQKEDEFKCDLCSFQSRQLKKLVQHRRKHTNEKPHSCCMCGYTSTRRDNLHSHARRIHSQPRMYSDTFTQPNINWCAIERHMLLKTAIDMNNNSQMSMH